MLGVWAGTFTVPALAQVAIEGALQSDYRVRGYSISDEAPSASLSFSYDDPSGTYFGGAIVGTIRNGEPSLLGVQAGVGYAVRVGPSLSFDAGVSKTQYFMGYGSSRNYDYSEIYAGIAIPHVSARVSYSPDYYRNDMDTLYAEVDAGFEPSTDLFLSAHAGLLTYLSDPPAYLSRRTIDWRVGASRQLGSWGVHLDVSGRIHGRARYVLPGGFGSGENAEALVLSLTRAF